MKSSLFLLLALAVGLAGCNALDFCGLTLATGLVGSISGEASEGASPACLADAPRRQALVKDWLHHAAKQKRELPQLNW